MQIIPFDSPNSRRQQDFVYKNARTSTLQHACGKAILVGEHAVVYGARAIALPLPSQRIQVNLDLDASKRIDHNRLVLNGDNLPADACHVIADAFQLLGLKPSPVHIEGHSNLAIGAGLGSSASLCVVTIRAIAGAYGISLDRKDISRLGNELEKRFHGNPSGLDTAVVAYEQVIEFRRGNDPRPVNVGPVSVSSCKDLPWRFALVDSRARASTKHMIDVARPYFTGPRQQQIIDDFEQIADQTVEGLTSGSIGNVAEAMSAAHRHLTQSGVVTPTLKTIIERCIDLGCPSAKTTGAGGGGTIIALLDPEKSHRQLSHLVADFGHDYVHEVRLPCGD